MKVSFLASHGGTAVRQIISAIENGLLPLEVGIVITNNKDSAIYNWCIKNGISVSHISGVTHPDDTKKDEAILSELLSFDTEIIVLSGYMKKIGLSTLSKYSNKILNIHPALLPRHGGKGLFGDRVHESVLKSGDIESGATVQFINEEYDEGPIIAQQKVSISANETLSSLKNKIQAIEGELYINALNKIV